MKMQSPQKAAAREPEKKLHSSAGYITLYDREDCTFAITAGGTYLRQTLRIRNREQGGMEQREILYIAVSDMQERERIKNISKVWRPYKKGKKRANITVYKQYGQRGEPRATGYYKVTEETGIIDGKKKANVRYYKKRR